MDQHLSSHTFQLFSDFLIHHRKQIQFKKSLLKYNICLEDIVLFLTSKKKSFFLQVFLRDFEPKSSSRKAEKKKQQWDLHFTFSFVSEQRHKTQSLDTGQRKTLNLSDI